MLFIISVSAIKPNSLLYALIVTSRVSSIDKVSPLEGLNETLEILGLALSPAGESVMVSLKYFVEL